MPLSGERERERERERESNPEKAAEEICSSGRPSFFFFFAARQDGGLLEMSCFLSMVSLMVHLANAS